MAYFSSALTVAESIRYHSNPLDTESLESDNMIYIFPDQRGEHLDLLPGNRAELLRTWTAELRELHISARWTC